MKYLKLLLLALLTASLTLTGPSASAAKTLEKDFATKINSLRNPVVCNGPEAFYGGSFGDPHYNACFRLNGDIMKPTDARADGNAAVMLWHFYPPRDGGQRGYKRSASRKGVCIYTGGSEPGFRSGKCDKNLPEHGLLQFKAGMRVKPGSTRLSDMRFGGRVCIMLDGTDGISDPDCIGRSL